MVYAPRLFTCPTCSQDFYLKDHKLRRWLDRKAAKPDMLGPYCNYVCANRAKIKFATKDSKDSTRI